MGLQLVNAALLTWGSWHPQYGGSLSALLPGPRYSNASDVAISTKWCPAAGGLQRLYFPVCAEKAKLFIRQWTWLWALCRIQPVSCSSRAGCFSRRTRRSLQGEAIREQRNDAASELSMGNTILVAVGWALLSDLPCWWLCIVWTWLFWPDACNAVNGRHLVLYVFSYWRTHEEPFAMRV